MVNENDTCKNQRIAIIVLACLLVGVAVTLFVDIFKAPQGHDPVATPDMAAGVTFDESLTTSDDTAVSYIAIPGFSSMTISSNTYKQQVNLYNPETNTVTMNMKIGLTDGTQIWAQDNICPGDRLTEITLSAIPPLGVYDAVLIIDCYLPDGTKVNGGIVQFKLNVI